MNEKTHHTFQCFVFESGSTSSCILVLIIIRMARSDFSDIANLLHNLFWSHVNKTRGKTEIPHWLNNTNFQLVTACLCKTSTNPRSCSRNRNMRVAHEHSWLTEGFYQSAHGSVSSTFWKKWAQFFLKWRWSPSRSLRCVSAYRVCPKASRLLLAAYTYR